MLSANKILLSAVIAAALATALPASAAITTFSGQDEAAIPGGSSPNASTAQAAFLAAAANYGAIYTDYLDAVPVGYAASFRIAAASVALTGPDLGVRFSGINDQNSTGPAGQYFGYSTIESAVDKAHWLGFPQGSATFTLDAPSHSFGFYMTGMEAALGVDFSVQFDGVAASLLNPPVNLDGGIAFYGFTSDDSFSVVTISRSSLDAWGIDGITVNGTAAVPEPAAWTLLITGFGLVGSALRRRRPQVACA